MAKPVDRLHRPDGRQAIQGRPGSRREQEDYDRSNGAGVATRALASRAQPLAIASGDGAPRGEHPGAQRWDDRRQPLFADPHSDPATYLIAAGAHLIARRGGGAPREIAVEEFTRGPYRNALASGELLVGVEVAGAVTGDGDRPP